jgi:hypothetical protein
MGELSIGTILNVAFNLLVKTLIITNLLQLAQIGSIPDKVLNSSPAIATRPMYKSN